LNLLPLSILSGIAHLCRSGAHRGKLDAGVLRQVQPGACAGSSVSRVWWDVREDSALPAVVAVFDADSQKRRRGGIPSVAASGGLVLLKPRAEVKKELRTTRGFGWNVECEEISYDQLVADEKEISILKLDIKAPRKAFFRVRRGLQKTKSIILEVTFTPHYENDAGFPSFTN